MVDWINSAYELMDAAHLSMATLVAIVGLFFVALFFSSREALTWFLKTDALRREIKSLREDLQILHADFNKLNVTASSNAVNGAICANNDLKFFTDYNNALGVSFSWAFNNNVISNLKSINCCITSHEVDASAFNISVQPETLDKLNI